MTSETTTPSCWCSKPDPKKPFWKRLDRVLWGSAFVIAVAWLTQWLAPNLVLGIRFLEPFCLGVFELMNKMWWGILIGLLAVGFLAKVPREFVISLLGKPGTFGGILRATAAGVLLDLCSHGILMVGMQLYKRWASLGQTMAFLIASPWSSLSLTLILFSLIGWKWTLLFLALSAVIAILSGLLFEFLVKRGVLPKNPETVDLPNDFRFWNGAKFGLQKTKFVGAYWKSVASSAWTDSQMVLLWIFFGTVLAAAIRAFLSPDIFGAWFGPTVAGLGLTLVAATIIEVCSEGSSPIAADLLNRAGAPGNAFTFLMTGVATDYTAIMALRETTHSWKIALFLPLMTVPQILVLSWLMNHFAAN